MWSSGTQESGVTQVGCSFLFSFLLFYDISFRLAKKHFFLRHGAFGVIVRLWGLVWLLGGNGGWVVTWWVCRCLGLRLAWGDVGVVVE
ncbi:hypothetical protein HOY82DRAFT_563985 [Tuber indicum]|nr:hypothetical protein HOY82DRAFT_563985 [Tuber indicum]